MILLENVWCWFGLAFGAAVIGWAFFQNSGHVKSLILGIGAAIFLLTLGLTLVYGVQTDRKKVIQTVYDLAAAIADNSVDKVCSHIEPEARETIAKAKHHMGLVKIEWTKVRDLKVGKVNYYTSPPSAVVAFRGTVGGRVLVYDMPFTVQVQFTEILFRQGADGKWYVTDQCKFVYPGYDGK